VEATILLACRPAAEGKAEDTAAEMAAGGAAPGSERWRRRTVVALARCFRDARVRLFVSEAPRQPAGSIPRQPAGSIPRQPAGSIARHPVGSIAPEPASAAGFDALVLIERQRAGWPPLPRPDAAGPDAALAWLAGAQVWRGRSRTLLERAPSAAPGACTPGIVLVATTVRAPALSHADFDAWWRDRHGPLALRHHAGLCGYEQIVFERPVRAEGPALDGLALLHFASAGDLRERFYDSEAGRDAIRADTARFLEVPRCTAQRMVETWVRR
jgi:hypothetical protein